MSVAYVVSIEVAPEALPAWDAWHSDVHMPDVLGQPGFVAAEKYRDETDAADGWARFVVVYHLRDRRALADYFAGDAMIRIRRDHEDRFGRATRLSRQIWRQTR